MRNLPVTFASAATPRQPGRYGFAQPAHVIWADAGVGTSQAAAERPIVQMSRLNMTVVAESAFEHSTMFVLLST
jgi:hypothetical protein